MAKQLQLRRGSTAQHSSFTGAVGEITIDTDKDTLVVHDGYTQGGEALLREDLNNLANNSIGLGKIATGTQGQVLYYDASGQLVALSPGTAGYVLKTNGAGQNPSWAEGLPSQTSNSGKVLTTNGTSASWTYGGKLVKVHTYRNDTRQVTSSTSNYNYFTWTLTKVSSTSTLCFHVTMPGYGSDNSGKYIGIGIDGTYNWDGLHQMDQPYENDLSITQYRTGISSGNRTITLNAIPVDGSSNRTVNVINPNTSDSDTRNRQQATVFIVYEIEA